MPKDLPDRRATASRRPPFFLVRAAQLALVAAFTASIGSVAAYGATGDYRLAGVMAVGGDRIGFLAVPDGGQVLIRQGSVVDGGTVTVFNERELRIEFPGRTVVLELTGDDEPQQGNPALGVVTSQDDNGHVMVRQVDADRAIEALEQTKPAKGAKPRDAGAEVGRRFAAIANLPRDARVVAVNEVKVTSAEKAIAEVERTLASGFPARLNLAATPGQTERRVYLIPQRDQSTVP